VQDGAEIHRGGHLDASPPDGRDARDERGDRDGSPTPRRITPVGLGRQIL
jgi:hypothetical protein